MIIPNCVSKVADLMNTSPAFIADEFGISPVRIEQLLRMRNQLPSEGVSLYDAVRMHYGSEVVRLIRIDVEGINLTAIKEHYYYARKKHPDFCDELIPQNMDKDIVQAVIKHELASAREDIVKTAEKGNLCFSTLLNCEVWEIHEAVAKGDTKQAIEECYDSIAILLRVIDALEGRQVLGCEKRNEKQEGGAE